jgi:transcriptional regulator of met regulon
MKDDNAPICAYHLRPNSTIVLIATNDPRIPGPTQNTEQSVVASIRSELNSIRNALLPDLESFLQHPTHDLEHRRLAELLLQALLRLDAIVPEPTWDDARKERKDAVREVQTMLDRLDDAWATSQT